MMNRIVPVITIILCIWTQSLEGRPFDDHLKHWPAKFYRTLRHMIEPITAEESGPPPVPQRGSPEETRRILNEIKKINQAFGYTRKNPDIALPRQGPSSGNNNYFYPRPVYQPAFIQNSKRPPYVRGNQERHNRGLGLYKKGTYYYPAQYLQLPLNFHPINYGVPYEGRGFKRPIVVEDVASDRIPKTMEELKTDMNGGESKKPTKLRQEGYSEYEEDEEPIGIIESIVKIVAGPSPQEEEEEGENYENYDSNEESNETEEEDERNPNVPTLNPPLLNDKFIHNKFKDGPNQDANVPEARSFNFSTPNFIKNLTDKFSKPSTVTPVILQEGSNIGIDVAINKKSEEEDYGDSEETSIEGLRAPWGGVFPGGPQSQRDALKQGGLIIQRLRVKNGSIAVAGPGGVATAGSGGTAIVGPEGLAITHPRSLTIAGPGARVYEVPESTNLEKQLRSLSADGTPENGVLVAVGPTVHYNSS